jgi:hypothetical protein
MMVTHTNWIPGYVSDLLYVLDVVAHSKGKPASRLRASQALESLRRHELSVCLMLELLEDRLTRFEESLRRERKHCDFGAYAEAMVFLDAIYLFVRMLLDCAVGVLRHRDMDVDGKGRELPKSFDDMVKRAITKKLPGDLNTVFCGSSLWFPLFKDRRDAIVHEHETYLIVFGTDAEGRRTAGQFSPQGKNQATGTENLREYVGTVMAGYQTFVDRLLEYWDGTFRTSRGVTVHRNRITFVGRSGNILLWAHKYGGYKDANLCISDGSEGPSN